MVEALDKMVTEGLTAELTQIAEERKAISEDRAKFVAKMQEASGTFDKFLVKQLSEEIKELHTERATQKDPVAKLEEFVTAQLSEEPKISKRSSKMLQILKLDLLKRSKV